MALLPSADWVVAESIAGIVHVNPFLPERVELERRALGPRFKEEGPVIRARPGEREEDLFGNIPALRERAGTLATDMRRLLVTGQKASRQELEIYEDLVLFLLYSRYMSALGGLVLKSLNKPAWDGEVEQPLWDRFVEDFSHYLHLPGIALPSEHDVRVIMAVFFQVERAFMHIYSRIIGGSKPAARLRAAVWQSVFTRDMRRYFRSLHRTMADVPTLIVGSSGSGKELVARAIGESCFIPFDPGTRRFKVNPAETYIPLSLAALAPTLIDSALFGHVKGAFATAYKDREGWLQKCSEYGAVFLDEIGDLDGTIQIKLLRVLETRNFQRVGSTDTLSFKGKIIAATNRDLSAEMQAGRFRHDLYYRLCADQVETPSLAEQLADRPEDLTEMVRFIAQGVLVKQTDGANGSLLGPVAGDRFQKDVEDLTLEVVTWIDRELGRGYAWPGNFRELGQCVRNIMIRGSYRPASRGR
ncbi:MAG TPA: sigma 54-interacting transcriptional regulator, partial [Isosphaeraceae bacterium]|nr:sigma 54-interacting transcriptional regulator [Isosphaeraceae bacterium]